MKKRVFECCRDQVEEGTETFNWRVYDLNHDTVSELLNTARTLPWAAPRRWIYVKSAHLAEDKLNSYLKDPSSRTTMILEAKKRSRIWSKLPRIEMPQGVNTVGWIMSKAKSENYQVDKAAAQALVELIGDDYQQLSAELEKLYLLETESREISRDSVLQMTRQTRDYDVFALIGAVAAGDAPLAVRVLGRLFESGMASPQIVAMLYWNFRRVLAAREMLDQGRTFRDILTELKIWSYKGRERDIRGCSHEVLVQILIRLRETDRLCKTTSGDPKIHLERVIVDTCRSETL
ncbi:MAG: DNA polymerase III subunit delta [Acidobacteriota bacterium]